MSAQKAISGVRRLGKEAYQFRFTSEFEYITLECKGTWRPTLLKVIWFRNHRKVESIPIKWTVREDRGPNGASGKAKFKPTFSVGLVVTLYKEKLRDRFEEKEYKYYIQDENKNGRKVLASFTIDLKEYANPMDMGTTDALEMTFHNESQKVERVVMGMTLSSQLLKRGKATDWDMQSTFSAFNSEAGSHVTPGDESDLEDEEMMDDEHTGRENGGVSDLEMDREDSDMGPQLKLGLNKTHGVSQLDTGIRNGKVPPTVTTQAPTPGTSLGPQLPPATTHQLKSCLRPTTSPSSHCTSSASPSPSPSHSPSPSPQLSRSPSPDRPPGKDASPASSPPTARSKPKKEKKGRKFFGKTPRVNIESSLEEQRKDSVSVSPPPISPQPTITDSSHRPWEEVNSMVKRLQETVAKLEKENKRLHASMEIQGWLFKRGVRGVTANVWRRRFFRVEGSRIYYYKTMCASQAQGFIDIDLVLGVKQVCPEEQDKNCCTFIVRCEGRTFQLQAVDQPTMRKWIRAIEFLADYRKSYLEGRNRDILEDLEASYL